MSELAQESLERQHHLQEEPGDNHARRAALVIGMLAAALALCEMAERSAQNAYLAHYIGASNEYAFYQARQNRALVLTQTAAILGALPATPETRATAAAAKAEAARLTEDSERGNGGKQIIARATAEGQLRDVALHRYEWFELTTSALQIAIVLASVSVVIKLPRLLWAGAAIGVCAAALGAVVRFGLV